MIKASDYFRDMYRHDWAIHHLDLVCLHFNMGSQLRSKRVRLTLFSVSFLLLFAFWLVALYCGLRGGLTTYALLLVAVVVILNANRTRRST
jgi:hypothetical protein